MRSQENTNAMGSLTFTDNKHFVCMWNVIIIIIIVAAALRSAMSCHFIFVRQQRKRKHNSRFNHHAFERSTANGERVKLKKFSVNLWQLNVHPLNVLNALALCNNHRHSIYVQIFFFVGSSLISLISSGQYINGCYWSGHRIFGCGCANANVPSHCFTHSCIANWQRIEKLCTINGQSNYNAQSKA